MNPTKPNERAISPYCCAIDFLGLNSVPKASKQTNRFLFDMLTTLSWSPVNRKPGSPEEFKCMDFHDLSLFVDAIVDNSAIDLA